MAARAKQIMAHLDVPIGVVDRCSDGVLQWLLETVFLMAEQPGDEHELVELSPKDIEDFFLEATVEFPAGCNKTALKKAIQSKIRLFATPKAAAACAKLLPMQSAVAVELKDTQERPDSDRERPTTGLKKNKYNSLYIYKTFLLLRESSI
jgi:hypothetical protein